MLNFNNLTAHTSQLIYIAGIPYINVHVHYIDENIITYHSIDIKFRDTIAYIDRCSGYNEHEQSQILSLISQKRDFFFSLAREQGVIHVQTEQELYNLEYDF